MPFAQPMARRLNIVLLLDKALELHKTLAQDGREAVDLHSAINFITTQLRWESNDPFASSDSGDLDE